MLLNGEAISVCPWISSIHLPLKPGHKYSQPLLFLPPSVFGVGWWNRRSIGDLTVLNTHFLLEYMENHARKEEERTLYGQNESESTRQQLYLMHDTLRSGRSCQYQRTGAKILPWSSRKTGLIIDWTLIGDWNTSFFLRWLANSRFPKFLRLPPPTPM